jgi:methylmalonyl-CoA mutase N-terminal domain/subunit
VPLEKLRGTLQNDILKEFHAQNEFVFPPGPSVKLVIDTIEYCTQHMPQWNTVSVSGYHIREAGATGPQELAFTIADGMCYVEESIKRGLDPDAFAPRLSFFWDVHNEFFEEIAKLRAARRMWAHMRDRYKAKNERSWWLRCHCQTAGVSLTEQQPMVNIIRVAYQALAAVLGGTQSLHTNSMDETLALPTENAVKIALRTQQVIAEETGVTRTVDPLGGSYFVEALTDQVLQEAQTIIDETYARFGGVPQATEQGYFRRLIGDSSHAYAKEFDKGERVMIGVNKHLEDDYERIPILKIDERVEREQIDRLRAFKQQRDAKRHAAALEKLREVALAEENVMPALIEAAAASATVGEMMHTLEGVYGRYDGGPEL